ncbi:hypothetical protein Zmor_015574 [Zophobas morio]|uniref:Uncharacterized protein n=1 Tax=Zophobas morio TaxID=2755281 RepID=A0AA38ILU5_9CUCU|nr:hypothetical protein Zmor_015574 [Zophobas morio]
MERESRTDSVRESHEYVSGDTCGRVWVTQPHLEPPESYPDYRYDGFEGETLTDYTTKFHLGLTIVKRVHTVTITPVPIFLIYSDHLKLGASRLNYIIQLKLGLL